MRFILDLWPDPDQVDHNDPAALVRYAVDSIARNDELSWDVAREITASEAVARIQDGETIATDVVAAPAPEPPTDTSCEARIAEHMASRETQFNARFKVDDLDDEEVITAWTDSNNLDDDDQHVVNEHKAGHDEAPDPSYAELDARLHQTIGESYDELVERLREELREDTPDEDVLHVETKVTIRVLLSTGGPGDWVDADLDLDDRTISNVSYHFQDWFDHAERQVDDDSSLAALAQYFAEIVELPGGAKAPGY